MKKKPNRIRKKAPWLGLAAMLATAMVPVHAGTFTHNFNTDPSGEITILFPAQWWDSGGVGGTGYISITDALNDQQGAFFINDFDNGANIGGFKATFKLRMGGGTANAADGFSFNWASDLPETAFGEEGVGTGLTVTFDIYDNGGGEAPAIDIKAGGVVLQSVKFAKADILTGDEFVDVNIEYRNSLLNVDFKGASVVKDLAVVIPPMSGARFGFGARTGGENNNHWVDDLTIQTFVQSVPSISGLTSTPDGIVIKLLDVAGSAVNASSIAVTVDGVAVTGTSAKTGDETTFTYANPTPYAPGSSHTIVLTYKYGTAGTTATHNLNFSIPSYTVIPAANALAAGTVDTTKRGFLWSVHQMDPEAELPNTLARTEAQLAGWIGENMADPNAIGAAADVAASASPATAPIQFVVPEVINFSQFEGESNGNAVPDLQMPGIPGLGGGSDNIAAEIITAIEFPAPGSYTLIVNSDDGFRTSAGKNPRDITSQIHLGSFEGGRGATDTSFNIYVEAAGIYGFRTIWEEGGGGANIEWLSVVDGAKVLINDTASNPKALKAYQLPASALPAYVKTVMPAIGPKALIMSNTVEAVLVDAGTQVTASSVTLKLNGANVPVTATKTGRETKVVHNGANSLQGNTEYTAELSYTDTAGPKTVTWKFTTGLLSPNLFVIEAEDFDFDGGQTNPQKGVEGMDVDVMPYLGGAYDQLSAIENIDFVNGDGLDSDLYRQEVGTDGDHEVNMGAALNVAGGNGLSGTTPINSSDRGAFTVTQNYRIGWVASGEWQNYTRTFPNNGQNGWWKVYAALSYDGNAEGQLSGSLSRVTSGVGTETQTVESLGTFNANGSGGWGNNNLVPMKTASGGDAVVKLSGKQTVRFNLGSGDFDFLIFTPAAPPPPSIVSAPLDSVKRNELVLDWTLTDSDVQVDTASVKVFIDGQDLSSKVTTTKTTSGATVRLDNSGVNYTAGDHTWRLEFKPVGSSAPPVTGEGKFLVNPYPAEGVFVIEAEDFNYDGGLSNPQKGVEGMDVDVMPYLGGAYANLGAIKGIDYVNADANDSDLYRTETDENGENEVNIGRDVGNRYSVDRGVFSVTENFRIGWVNVGDWQNYTRTFPQGNFNVWAAMSFDGRGSGQLNGSLDKVTSNPAQANQTVERLGSFNAPGSGGWGRNELVPMKDANGNVATVTMGGVQTVRFNLGSGDIDYLLFVPTEGGSNPERPTIRVTQSGANITLTWDGGGALEAADSILGPWSTVAGSSGVSIPIQGTQRFYRIKK